MAVTTLMMELNEQPAGGVVCQFDVVFSTLLTIMCLFALWRAFGNLWLLESCPTHKTFFFFSYIFPAVLWEPVYCVCFSF